MESKPDKTQVYSQRLGPMKPLKQLMAIMSFRPLNSNIQDMVSGITETVIDQSG